MTVASEESLILEKSGVVVQPVVVVSASGRAKSSVSGGTPPDSVSLL